MNLLARMVLLKRLCCRILDDRMIKSTQGAVWSSSPLFMIKDKIYPRQ